MKYQYQPAGICPYLIEFEIRNKKVYNIQFHGGCLGNTKIIAKLLDGWEIEKIIKWCKGNTCGTKNTSCADQLAVALEKQLTKEKMAN